MIALAMFNNKGGVGKTSTSVNLAAALADDGHRVLLIDSDAQAHACKSIGFNDSKAKTTYYDVLKGSAELEKAIYKTDFDNLWIVPSDISLSATDVELATKTGKEYILERSIKTVEDKFDFVVIDCPPFLGVLTINALIASTDILITCTMSYLSLEGVSDLLDLVEVINDTLYLPKKIEVSGVLMCMYDVRTRISRKVRKELERYFGDQVFNTYIPQNVAVNESQTKGVPVIHFDSNSKAAIAYRRLAKEILARQNNKEE